MLHQLQKTYLEAEVLTASPVRLIEILFDLSVNTLERARDCCRKGDILGRGQAVSKVVEILAELTSSLNFEAGGELAQNYARLYDYCQRRVLEAHLKQSEPMLQEIQCLLVEMREAWQAVVQSCSPRCLADEEVLAEQGVLATSEPRFSCVG
jgi:flagellar protein FliS